jgi:hypothetical protein
MKLTNRLNLPEPIVEAVRRDSYSKGEADFSVTELLRPPRIAALERELGDHVEEDVSEHIYRLLGQTMAVTLERAGVPERRFIMEVAVDGKIYSVSGKPDRFKDGLLQDWKLTTVWKAKGQACPPEFEEQLNLYGELMRSNSYEVRALEAVLILRDWSKLEMFRNEDYPRAQVATLSAPIWKRERAQAFARDRIRLHLAARKRLPLCSGEERWAKADVYAVMRKGRKTAVRLLNNELAAKTYIQEKELNAAAHYVERRPGENTRCKFYCPVAKFCEQYQATLKSEAPAPAPQPAAIADDSCEECGSELVPGKYGRPYCKECYIAKKEARKS